MLSIVAPAVEKHRKMILDAERFIWQHPAPGYKEVVASEYMEKAFENLGYDIVRAGNIPGFYTLIDTGKEGPEILILGELDSLIIPSHPECDKETGAVHACGHHAQCAALLGVAAALKEKEVLDKLCGKIRLCVVPAEELIDFDYRSQLRKEGKIKYFGGKSEFLSRGYFDGVDLAFMIHTTSSDFFSIGLGGVGCLAKRIDYRGVSSHAGSSPWNGKNALYAANVGLSGINALRETFREDDLVRVHPIITHGGDSVNAIPDWVHMESYIRGKSFEAIRDANDKVNKALVAGALALGANIEIQDIPGYAPNRNSALLTEVAIEAQKKLDSGKEFVKFDYFSPSSTDMGDLSCIMPTIHPQCPGAVGKSHSDTFYIKDPEMACVMSAKWQIMILLLLLDNNAQRAKEVIENFTPRFKSKEEYFKCVDSFYSEGERIDYSDEKSFKITL